MKISIITVFPELHEPFIKLSLIGKAIEKGIVECQIIRLSSLVSPKERIDEPTCGPGSGMIIKPELIQKAIEQGESTFGPGFKIFFSPQGIKLDQRVLRNLGHEFFGEISSYPSTSLEQTKTSSEKILIQAAHPSPEPCRRVEGLKNSLSTPNHLILICSRYEGIDVRVEEHFADLILSIGDYVLMGGDVPAQVFLEGILRLLPGIVGKQESVQEESFSKALLDHPEYGLPVEWQGMKIPDIVLSGNHGKIAAWRKEEACKKTVMKRFDWFRANNPTKEEIACAKKFIPRHYMAVMHTQIMLKGGLMGESSIASLDIHDIARSCTTYGIENFFIVSPLKDQRAILDTFLNFWRSPEGIEYNQSRHKSIQIVRPIDSLDDVIKEITEKEGKKPLLIATSAKEYQNIQSIDYQSQSLVWQHDQPILFIFGTGQGLANIVLDRCDYLLAPIYGMTDYNHLSVRAAASIILDRWMGLYARKKPHVLLRLPLHSDNKQS